MNVMRVKLKQLTGRANLAMDATYMGLSVLLMYPFRLRERVMAPTPRERSGIMDTALHMYHSRRFQFG